MKFPTANEIAEYLDGTCKSVQDAADQFGISDEEALDLVAESEIECCSVCGWWTDFFNDDGSDIICNECCEED